MKKLTLLLSILALFLFALMPVYAADITVDENCSLADAIKGANTDEAVGNCPAGDGADVIGLSADIQLQRALPLVTSTITIQGNQHTVRGKERFHIIGINSRGRLTLDGLTITSGRAAWGGAIGNLNGVLNIRNSTITNSSAEEGGAIANEGTLNVENSTISNNSASVKGGAIYNLEGTVTISNSNLNRNSGRAIHNDDGVVTIDNSFFSGNSARYGAAIYNDEGTLKISNTSFNGNEASRDGGAIDNFINWDDDEDNVTIVSSTFRNNSAAENGGAIENCCGDLTITNSTFVGNSAGENGGAISNSNDYDTTRIIYSTFFGNSSGQDGGGIHLESGDAEVILRFSIITGSKGGSDCFGRLHTETSNIIEDGSCYAEISGDPLLGAQTVPEDGSPAYIPLLANSIAIDAGQPRCVPNVDQIGTERPQGAGCDIGVIEYVSDD